MAAHTLPLEPLVPFKRGAGVTTAQRSKLMGRVRQTKTAPEEAVAAWLRAHKLSYRRNVRTLPGRPDFANQRAGFAIFVHGCFWHRHPGCSRATTPTRNHQFWLEKFAANIARDAARTSELEQTGLHTITVWECETKNADLLAEKLAPLLEARPRQGLGGPKRMSEGFGPPGRRLPAASGSSGPSANGTSVRHARGVRALHRARPEGARS